MIGKSNKFLCSFDLQPSLFCGNGVSLSIVARLTQGLPLDQIAMEFGRHAARTCEMLTKCCDHSGMLAK